MAYTVGSASVDIVPDFRNAQIAITRFFEKQQNELRIPAKLDIDKDGAARVERDARNVGERVGKAVNEGAAKSDIAAIKQAQKTENVIAAQRRKIQDEASAAEGRAREKAFKDEERAFQDSFKATQRAIAAAVKDSPKDTTSTNRVRVAIEGDNKEAERVGREQGGLVVRAAKGEIHQNAGLIAAALGAAIGAGAPVVLAASTALFAGIGAAGAFQSQHLRATWVGLWDEIKTNAIADSASLIPVFNRMAGTIGRTFEQLRPALRDAFVAIGPQIDSLSARISNTAEIVFPSLVRAVQGSGPVVTGLGQLLEKTGTGLGDFFDRITTHAPAAGRVFSSLGDSMQVLLPTIGELVGQGAELASAVLPHIAGALGGLLHVVDAVSSVLPQIGSGFLYFRLAQGAGRYVSNLGDSMQKAAEKGGMFASMQSSVGSALGKIGGAMGAVGVVFAAYGAMVERQDQQIQSWTQVLLKGGDAADQLKKHVADLMANGAPSALADEFDKATKAAERQIAALTPLEKAQRNLDIANRALADGLGDEKTTSSELAGLKQDVALAASREAAEQDKLARATEGVTKAMGEEADAALARVDSSFAYQQAVQNVAEAQQKLKDTQADSKSTATDLSKANLDLAQAYEKQVVAAGEVASSNLPAAMSDQQKAVIAAKGSLDELNKLIASGVQLPQSLMDYRQQLINITNGADGATLAQAELISGLSEVGIAVEAIPDSAAVKIDAPTDEVKQRLIDLGFTVTEMPDGHVKVEAVTDDARANIGNLSTLLAILDTTKTDPYVGLNADDFNTRMQAAFGYLAGLAGSKTEPTITANPVPINTTLAQLGAALARINGTKTEPTVTAQDHASGILGSIIGLINSVHDKSVTVTTNLVTNRTETGNARGMATGGAVEDALAGAPRYDDGGTIFGIGGPTADLNLIRASPGEHMLDARDVALMGGQQAVYAFREMLNSGRLSRPPADTGVRHMVGIGAPRMAPAPVHSTRDVTILTSDNPRAIIRAMRAEEQQAAALAPVWT